MRALPVGLDALLIELDGAAETAALHAELLRMREAGQLPRVREIVPAALTVLLDGVDDPRALARQLAGRRVPALPDSAGEVITVPVHYDGEDLPAVAALWGSARTRSPGSTPPRSTGWRSAGSRPASAT